MQMFESVLKLIPKNRLDFVNDLEIPDDIRSSEINADLGDVSFFRSDSLTTEAVDSIDYEAPHGTVSTDSSISLSNELTDSEIDYYRYRRFKNRSDPFGQMRAVLDRFPPGYLESLERIHENPQSVFESIDLNDGLKRRKKFSWIHQWSHSMDPSGRRDLFSFEMCQTPELEDPPPSRSYYLHDEELELKMKRFFDEECSFFTPDDPGLLELQEALASLDLKVLESDLESISSP